MSREYLSKEGKNYVEKLAGGELGGWKTFYLLT